MFAPKTFFCLTNQLFGIGATNSRRTFFLRQQTATNSLESVAGRSSPAVVAVYKLCDSRQVGSSIQFLIHASSSICICLVRRICMTPCAFLMSAASASERVLAEPFWKAHDLSKGVLASYLAQTKSTSEAEIRHGPHTTAKSKTSGHICSNSTILLNSRTNACFTLELPRSIGTRKPQEQLDDHTLVLSAWLTQKKEPTKLKRAHGCHVPWSAFQCNLTQSTGRVSTL